MVTGRQRKPEGRLRKLCPPAAEKQDDAGTLSRACDKPSGHGVYLTATVLTSFHASERRGVSDADRKPDHTCSTFTRMKRCN